MAHGDICTSIGERDFRKCGEILSSNAFCEIRGDVCRLSSEELEKLLSAERNVIFTYRFKDWDRKIALEQTLLAVKKGVLYVDIDLEAPSGFLSRIKKAIAEQPEKGRTKLIISWHSNKTPSLEELEKKVVECKGKGADIVKIVPAAANLEEASRVLRLYSEGAKSLVAFASGKAGSFTRIACIGLGAPFTYCHCGTPTAEGQISVEEMRRELSPEPSSGYFRIGDMSESGLFSRFCEKPSVSRKKKGKSVCIPCSKSIVQRALLAAAMTNGQSVLRNFDQCDDIKSAIAFIRKCGCVVKTTRDGNSARGEKMLIVRSAGISKWKTFQVADAGESGLLLRMLMPVCAFVSSIRHKTAITSKVTITGNGSLTQRDLSSCMDSLKSAGIKCKPSLSPKGKTVPVTITGASFKKSFSVSGKETSQIVTGLLMVLPLLSHDTLLIVEEAASIPYIDLTVKVLEAFGITVSYRKDGRNLTFRIEGRQAYTPVDMFLESDWSGASNFITAGAIASSVSEKSGSRESFTVKKMDIGSAQADERIINVLKQCGAVISTEKPERSEFASVSDNRYDTRHKFYQGLSNITVSAEELSRFRFDATDSPDLFPILSTLAVFCKGQSRIRGIHRLTNKESNRAESILLEFSRMGYHLHIEEDELVVEGDKLADNGRRVFCSSHNDHRIAMAIIICALFRNHFSTSRSDIYLDDIGCIDKSFPTFVERLQINGRQL